MHSYADQFQEKNRKIASNSMAHKKASLESPFQFAGNRSAAALYDQIQTVANNSTQSQKMAQLQAMADVKSAQLLQMKANETSLPDTLKIGIENLSGISMDDVKVNRNSSKPAQLHAHAYTQGTDIYLGPGQEKQLHHEAWHVVQQKQGRVKPTMQMKDKVNINDDASLEKEADIMGYKALHNTSHNNIQPAMLKSIRSPSIQRKEINELVKDIEAVMDKGKLKKSQITTGLKKLSDEVLKDTNFPRSLVEFVKQRNNVTDFSITDLDEVPKLKAVAQRNLKKTWTFRHYTKEKYGKLKSLALLEAEGKEGVSANTNDKDWEELGNQGYVFGLISIDGQVPHRTWLSQMKYYAEYDLSKLSSLWVSGDMLDEKGRKLPSIQGSGKVIIAALSKMLDFINVNVATAIDEKFANKLEAKVPPSILGTPVWKDV